MEKETPPPKKLYKYKKFDTLSLQTIANNELYFANPFKDFNDPFDSKNTPFFSGPKAKIQQYLLEKTGSDILDPAFDALPDPIIKRYLDETGILGAFKTRTGKLRSKERNIKKR